MVKLREFLLEMGDGKVIPNAQGIVMFVVHWHAIIGLEDLVEERTCEALLESIACQKPAINTQRHLANCRRPQTQNKSGLEELDGLRHHEQ